MSATTLPTPGQWAETERNYHRQLARWWRERANTQPPAEDSGISKREATYHEEQGAHWERVRLFCIKHERSLRHGPKRKRRRATRPR